MNHESETFALEACYNGDYPGTPCIRLNGKWLSDDAAKAICRIYGVLDLPALFDLLGLKKLPGSVEHEHWTGKLQVIISD